MKDLEFFRGQPLFVLDYNTHKILDVNEAAISKYGYSLKEFGSMALEDLGEKKAKHKLLETEKNGSSSRDDIWILSSKDGTKHYVQFTHHVFSKNGQPIIFAVAHNVNAQIKNKEKERLNYPKVSAYQGNSPLAKITWDNDLNVRDWSSKAEDLLGWSENEVIEANDFFEQLVHSKEVGAAQEKITKAAEHKKTHYSAEEKIRTKEGHVLDSKWYNSLIYDKNGDLSSVQSLITDVSSHKESEELFRKLSEKTLVGVFLVQNFRFIHVNPRMADIFGYEQEKLIGDIDPFKLVHPSHREELQKGLGEMSNENPLENEYETKGITKDGQEIDLTIFGTYTQYQGKEAIVGTLIDTTQNKEIMRNYQASVESFRDLFDSISDAIFIQDKDGRILQVNQGAVDMYGFEENYYIGKTPDILSAPDEIDLFKTQNYVKEALDGNPQSFKWWGQRKNGEVFPEEIIVKPGNYFGEDVVIMIARDISYRHNAEEELRKNEEMFRQLFQNSPISIALLDSEQEVRQVNESFKETFGYNTKELKGQKVDDVIVPKEEKETAEGISDEIFKGEAAFHTGKRLHKDGDLLDVFIYGVPVNVDETTIAIYAIYVDITDRKEAERKVKKSLNEKEVLLSEIHHRVKNNLAVITGLLELQAFSTDSDEAADVLRSSQMRINSIGLVHEKLYQSKNLSEISFGDYLEELIDEILDSLEVCHEGISIIINAESFDMTIEHAIPCGLILNELITNAVEHAFENQEGEIVVNIGIEDGQVLLSVEDDGRGIADDASLEETKSLGFKLIRTLTSQLNAKAGFIHDVAGTRFELEFKHEK